MKFLQLTINFVDEAYKEKIPHFVKTLEWILKLNPEADEASQIAAYSHDIERAFSMENTKDSVANSKDGFLDKKINAEHQQKSALIMKKFLEKNKADKVLIDKAVRMISKHEYGGDADQNLLQAADSLSFFEVNAEIFINKMLSTFGYQKIKDKFDFMYNRITDENAKNYATPLYSKYSKLLMAKVK